MHMVIRSNSVHTIGSDCRQTVVIEKTSERKSFRRFYLLNILPRVYISAVDVNLEVNVRT